ncbi:MAG: acylphosphatase [Bacillota bacterium]
MWEEADMLPANAQLVLEQGKPEVPFHAFISGEGEEKWQDILNAYAKNWRRGLYFKGQTGQSLERKGVVTGMKRLHLKIYGLVQGVNFRATARRKAHELGLAGWVKNMPDETVETVAEGEEEKLEEYKKWCQKGPSAAMVDQIQEKWEEATGEFKGFGIK